MINLNIEGMDEINEKINEARQKYPEACKQGIKLSCIEVEGRAKYLCPVDTGRLRASITWSMGGDVKSISFTNRNTKTKNTVRGISSGEDFEWYGIVGTDVEYAPWIEFGTVVMKSQPYLLPALYDKKAEILKIFKDVLKV
jgi:hypothetical protein